MLNKLFKFLSGESRLEELEKQREREIRKKILLEEREKQIYSSLIRSYHENFEEDKTIANFFNIDGDYRPVKGSRTWCEIGEYTLEESNLPPSVGVMLTPYITGKHIEEIKINIDELSKYLHKKSDIKLDSPYYVFYNKHYIDNSDKRFLPVFRGKYHTPDYLSRKRLIPFTVELVPDDIVEKSLYLRKEFEVVSSYDRSTLYKNIEEEFYVIECMDTFTKYYVDSIQDYERLMEKVNLLKLQL